MSLSGVLAPTNDARPDVKVSQVSVPLFRNPLLENQLDRYFDPTLNYVMPDINTLPRADAVQLRARQICESNNSNLEVECRAMAVAEIGKPSVLQVNIMGGGGNGSGFAIDPAEIFWREPPQNGDFYVLTCEHVTEGAEVNVLTKDGVLFDNVEVVEQTFGSEPEDMALLLVHNNGKIPPPSSPIAQLDTLSVGSMVFSIGSPLGLKGTFTAGFVSYIGERPEFGPGQWIQFDAATNQGNSGGPIFTTNGEIAGIVRLFAQDAQGHKAEGINVASDVRAGIVALFYAAQERLRTKESPPSFTDS